MANKTRKSTDAQIRAALKWASANIKQVKINLNYESDADIINWLGEIENKQGYIKELIRADIARVNKEIADEAIGWAEKEGIIPAE